MNQEMDLFQIENCCPNHLQQLVHKDCIENMREKNKFLKYIYIYIYIYRKLRFIK